MTKEGQGLAAAPPIAQQPSTGIQQRRGIKSQVKRNYAPHGTQIMQELPGRHLETVKAEATGLVRTVTVLVEPKITDSIFFTNVC